MILVIFKCQDFEKPDKIEIFSNLPIVCSNNGMQENGFEKWDKHHYVLVS